jgi:tRNA pseudouridine55 synthase
MPVFVVDKPLGPTSHDVVARARRLLGTRRVGHAGTLDPLASGVLLILSEEATKLSPWLTGSDKHYLAWIAFGAGTPTLDAEGPIDAWGDPAAIDAPRLQAAFAPFLTLREQVPPRFSAVKREGRASYRAARLGVEEPPLPARPAGYRSLELLAYGPRAALPDRFGPSEAGWRPRDDGRPFELPPPLAALPTALVALRVAAGTYVRAFARDLGAALGVPAHLAGLVRTRAGDVDLASAVPLDALAGAAGIAAADALPLPRRTVDDGQAARLRQGQRLPVHELPGDGATALLDPRGELVAIAELGPSGMRLRRVFPTATAPDAAADEPG